MKDSNTEPWQCETKKKTKHLAYWTLAWVLTTALASFGPTLMWGSNSVYSLLAIALNVIAGIFMVFANIKQMKSLDELQQKIQLDAMGISLGCTLVLGIAYSLLASSHVIGAHAEISHLIIIMGLSYLAAILVGQARYR